MRRILQFLSLLYPAQWRARYGAEYGAFLEQLNPRPGDILNVLSGAIKMHMKEWSYLRFAVAFSVASLLAGTILQFVTPDRYLSRAVISVPSEHQWVKAKNSLTSPKLLKTIIKEQNLYSSERLREPLEDVIDTMRGRDLKFKSMSGLERELTFGYPDSALSRSTMQTLMSRLESDPVFHALRSPGVPERVSPNRLRIFVIFLGTALMISLLAAKAVRSPGRAVMMVAIYGALGGALLGGGSYLIPEHYISTAMLIGAEEAPLRPDHLTDEHIAIAVLDGKFSRGLNTTYGKTDGGTPFLKIDYVASDPREAQATVQKVVNMELESVVGKPGNLEVVQNASLSFSPIGPNHLIFAEIGVLLGLIAGAFRASLTAVPNPQSA